MFMSKAELNELKMTQSRLEDMIKNRDKKYHANEELITGAIETYNSFDRRMDMLKARMASIEQFKSDVLTTITTDNDASITRDKVLTNRLDYTQQETADAIDELKERLKLIETRLNTVSERQVNQALYGEHGLYQELAKTDNEVTVSFDNQVIDGAEYATMTITNNKGDIIVIIEDTPAGTKISGKNITINQQGGTV
ncbi:hypothetical protein AB5N10_02170 [Weissella paramesenteroides]|uniref:hypothetical protein n=1 Tax=Weissella paramesenteroides TaxID=1249 RepID=UPI001C1FB14B|nr:hypothetical protein [Weissella paramesenteroides]MBU7556839.1 hypothetical protein [Weissella paramesenteroides]